MEYSLDRFELVAEREPGDTVSAVSLFDDARGCQKFAQRVFTFDEGRSLERPVADDDEVLFVLSGVGSITVDGTDVAAQPGVGVFVGAGGSWSVEAESALDVLSVLVRAPDAAGAGRQATVDLGAADRRSATAARQFVLGVTPDSGCPSVTQFIGFVPPGRAPDHYHLYDEVLYILKGEGMLHIGGTATPLRPGSCVHFPARLVHSLENTGDSELHLLGVFRPGGSPAEAYYPDGTPAVYPEES